MNDLYLEHHGILGQKWGIRRYQNADGSLTKAGKKRYAKEFEKTMNELQDNETEAHLMNWEYTNSKRVVEEKAKKYEEKARNTKNLKKAQEYLDKSKDYLEQSKILDKKIRDIDLAYSANRQKINYLINQLNNDPNLVYKIKERQVFDNKDTINVAKFLDSKYGKTPYGEHYDTWSVIGNKYVIRSSDNKNKSFRDPSNKVEKEHQRIRTTYYMY